MKIGIITTATLSLLLGIAAPLYAQEQHEEQKDQQEQKDTAKPEAKRAQPENKAEEAKPAAKPEEKTAQENKNNKPEEKTTQQHEQQAKAGAQHGRIPDDKFKANFGQQHTFRVSEGDYRNHRFQYGGYSFGFVGAWPSNWLYTQPVYVVDIGGVYYLCNPVYPGVNIALSFTL
jgi:hypothetical protein